MLRWTSTRQLRDTSIPRLLHTIYHSPEVACHFQHISLEYPGWADPNQREAPEFRVRCGYCGELEAAAYLVEKLRTPFTKLWIQKLQDLTVDAFITLLIASLPNLKSLQLGQGLTAETIFLGMMFRLALVEPQKARLPNFLFLKYAHIDGNVECRYDTAQVMLPFFYLPNIEKLSMRIDIPRELKWPGQVGHGPKLSRIHDLSLCNMKEQNLEKLLSVTPHLRRLVWEWYSFEGNYETPYFECDQVMRALSP
jgi:hypothetical protein